MRRKRSRVATYLLRRKSLPVARLKWRDLTGGEQSKLLLTEAETVIAELLGAKAELVKAAKRSARRPARGRNGSRRMERSVASLACH